jgi:non-heme chloroperoxidase
MNAPSPPPADGTFQAYRDWQQKNSGAAFPESELRNCFDTKPDGTMGAYKTAKSIGAAITAGAVKLGYSAMRLPILAFYALPAPLEDQLQRFKPRNADERAAMEQVYAEDVSFSRRSSRSLLDSVPGSRILELPGANHYVFLSNEADVLRELRALVTTLD